MTRGAAARWLLEQEARALATRLASVRPFALQETMLPAAALAPATQLAIEQFLLDGRYRLRSEVLGFLRWIRGSGAGASTVEQQRRFTVVRMRFNDALSQFDLFSEVITQRSESQNGVWLAGLDVLAADAMTLPDPPSTPPPIACMLVRGPGAAIRRARTRLPGGGLSPVSMVRIPRERMVGHGVGSSLVHECGHQIAALLDLVPSLREPLQRRAQRGTPREQVAWSFWNRWVSEVVSDLWSVGKLGISSTLGLMGVVSLPAWFVFRVNDDDPHPMPWVRVKLSCAIGDTLYPHRQWRELEAIWDSLYPTPSLDPRRRWLIAALEATAPAYAELLVSHRPPTLGGRSIDEVLPIAERRPAKLAARHRRRARHELREAAPTLALAILGQARYLGAIEPERESRIVGDLLTYWALRSTLAGSLNITATRARPLAAPAGARRALTHAT